ncbi:MAG TPA: DsbE family thiol:disulfide interchange protein [Paracoccaceae bacterium]|nr:DsbE family thiol:disulfide interchange protein [Paracoccaceae bacterium]
MSDRIDETDAERAEERGGGFRLWMLIPALGAAMVLAVFMLGLQRENVMVLPSPLIDEPVPEFALDPLREGQPGLTTADLTAPGVKLVNVWASWCGPCRAEHGQLMALAGRGIPLYGINYKDEPANATAFLDELGDPFERIGADTTGRTGIEFGVYGVPETFVVDGSGTIVYKHVGPIMPKDVERYILPAVEEARAGG